MWGEVKVGISGVSDPCHLRRKTELWIHLFLSLLQSSLRGLGKQVHLQRKPWASRHRDESITPEREGVMTGLPLASPFLLSKWSASESQLGHLVLFQNLWSTWIPNGVRRTLPPRSTLRPWGCCSSCQPVTCAQGLVCGCFSGSLVMVLLLWSSRTQRLCSVTKISSSCDAYLHSSASNHLHRVLPTVYPVPPRPSSLYTRPLSLFTSVTGTHTLSILHLERNTFSTLISTCPLW